MNTVVADVYRKLLAENLSRLNESQINLFKRIYSHGNLERSISEVVKYMRDQDLDMALNLVERTLAETGRRLYAQEY